MLCTCCDCSVIFQTTMSNPENWYDEEINAAQDSDSDEEINAAQGSDSDDYDEVDEKAMHFMWKSILETPTHYHDYHDHGRVDHDHDYDPAEAAVLAFKNYFRGIISKTIGIFLVNLICSIAGLIGYFFTYVCCKFRDVWARTSGGSLQQSLQEEASNHHGKLSRQISSMEENIKMVGFDEEAEGLLDKLVAGWKKREAISITGMGGIGKTTLARRLYDDPYVVNHFHLRGWCTVSQLCAKRKLLYDILSCFLNENDSIFSMGTAEDMGEKLHKTLKGKRYLIVLDDMWNIDAWNDIKVCFPEDGNGSRILVTTRINDVALNVSCSYGPHSLRFLSEDESWDLFEQKIFAGKSIPEELIGIGKNIVANCKGLPLAIAVLAGILAKEVKRKEFWKKVCQNMGSIISSDSEKVMDILALSYEHLPPSMKSCFLYVGLFPEDDEISVTRLIRLWIAEGFIQCTIERSSEDVAEDCLTDLINRSLLIVVKRRVNGGVKSCRMHDMLRDLCCRKSKGKKFLQLVCNCGRKGSCAYSSFRYCPYFHFYNLHFVHENLVFNEQTIRVFKLLKTLDLRHIILGSVPEIVVQLSHLRYLALRVNRIVSLPPYIFQLWKLETFILDGEKGERVTLTADVFKMARLRHLQVSQEMVFEEDLRQLYQLGFTAVLYRLQTISHLCPSGAVIHLLARTPNLRKLGLHLTVSETSYDPFIFSSLSRLTRLEKLKFEYKTLGMVPFSLPRMFHKSLKRMTLVGSHVKWTEMSTIGLLPNLEVLKIKDNFFSGALCETIDGGFRRLKFLKFSHMDLKRWISSSDHFPALAWLVINGCLDLVEIPLEMGDISTLQTIEVYRSSGSTVESARQIQEAQRFLGNDDFKVLVYHHFEE